MQITKRNVELRVDGSLMRVYVAAPKAAGKYPGIVFYSDIYQLGDALTLSGLKPLRFCGQSKLR